MSNGIVGAAATRAFRAIASARRAALAARDAQAVLDQLREMRRLARAARLSEHAEKKLVTQVLREHPHPKVAAEAKARIASGVSEPPWSLVRGGTLSARQQDLVRRLASKTGMGEGYLEIGAREVTATDLAALTKHKGTEHSIVILRDSRRILVDMGSYKGGNLPASTKTLLMHSHPQDQGSGMSKFISERDVEALKILDQQYSYMVTVDGTIYRFTQNTVPMSISEVVRRPHPIYVWVQN